MTESTTSTHSNFIVPPRLQPRDAYKATPELPEGRKDWPRCRVTVTRVSDGVVVATYDCNYSFLRTFEPFRQFRAGEWRDYALISPEYTSLAVLDLQTGEIIAREQPPQIDQGWQDRIVKYAKGEEAKQEARDKYPIGTPMPGAGFCPTEFYVPDWWEENDGSLTPDSDLWDPDVDERLVGEFGFYAGCVWGDDGSYKLQYVDLSRIADGIVTTDDRFGYVELSNMRVKDAVEYEADGDRVTIAVAVRFSRTTGKAGRYSRDGINWESDERENDGGTTHGEAADQGAAPGAAG